MENKINSNNISISLLNVKDKIECVSRLKDICKRNNIENVLIHYDITDEVFVPKKGVDYRYIALAKKEGFFADVHLMVEEPMKYISKIVALGANSITVHYEIENLCQILTHLNRLKMQKKIFNIGLAVNPETDIANLHEYLYLVDMILVMSVNPGMGGQKYIKDVNKKIINLNGINKILQVDGGVNEYNISEAKQCGIKSFVIGTYLTKDLDKLEENLLKINKLIL